MIRCIPLFRFSLILSLTFQLTSCKKTDSSAESKQPTAASTDQQKQPIPNKENQSPVPSETDKKDLDKLQGTWTIVSFSRDQRAVPEMKGKKVTIAGNKLTMAGEAMPMSFKLDSSKSPGELDFVIDNPNAPPTPPGIFEIDGNNLKLGFAIYGEIKYPDGKTESIRNKRPTTFEGKGARIFVLKRGDVVVESNQEKYKKLIVGKWRFVHGSSASPIFTDTEFTADGKVLALRKNETTQLGTYAVEGDNFVMSSPQKSKDGKTVDRKVTLTIDKLTVNELETRSFGLERMQ
jgi:uncharacterized protein (TIGR03067 family)